LDVHKKFIEWVVFDVKGDEMKGGRIDSTRKALEKLLAKWQGKPLQACPYPSVIGTREAVVYAVL
jgi:hypothetical protein